MEPLTDFDRGLVVGVLAGEGSFGGDGKQPQVTLRVHVRREALVRRLAELFPRSKLYGPYNHGDRHYFQWMVRGRALAEDLVPILDADLRPELDAHAYERYTDMRTRYVDVIGPEMTVAPRLADLAARYDLDEAAARALGALLEAVADDPAAPTALRAPAEGVDGHVADSLVALELPAVAAARVIADLGSGAGFPGLALAAALPEARVHLVESAAPKCAFLERATARARISNAEVVHARAEEWEDGGEACDLVTARALAPLSVLAEYAAPLLRQQGVLVAWKGRRDAQEEADGGYAAEQVGLEPVEIRRVRPFPAARDRHLHVMRKVAPTPSRFPRRPGMAAKRPLRAA